MRYQATRQWKGLLMDSKAESAKKMTHILPCYTDATGVKRYVSQQILSQLQDLFSHKHEPSDQLLEPVYLFNQVQEKTFTFNKIPSATATKTVNYLISCEDGQHIKGKATINRQTGCWSISEAMPQGYHQITVNYGSHIGHAHLIIAPTQCYTPGTTTPKKMWGPCLQLYALKSERNWGIGDFTDLITVIKKFAQWGADFIGLNPLHALYPAQPESASPYSPSSRQWLNIAYIDVEAVIVQHGNGLLKQKLHQRNFQSRLQALRNTPWIEYDQVIPLKLDFLREIYATKYFEKDPLLFDAFTTFTTHGHTSLRQQAGFDALQHYFYQQGLDAWGWPAWPKDYQHYSATEVQAWIDEHPNEVEFYIYLQWVAAAQLEQAQILAKKQGMQIGLYRDLAVGAAQGSAEVWSMPDLFHLSLSIGAPPDPLGPKGQYWGLPPIDPQQLRAHKYLPFIELLRANMRSSGALRIDHVMGLLRLWVIPEQKSAADGAYVLYPIEDLIHILCLESQRNCCLIIGEDLGTLPEGLDKILENACIYSYRVFLFERAPDGGYFSPEHYPQQAMTVIATHDMPTLKGWWHCHDLTLGKSLGIYQDQQALQQLYHQRHEAKQAILNSLDGHDCLPEQVCRDINWAEMTPLFSEALHQHIARCASDLVGVQLEDWLQMDIPVNVPGTCTEYPNWRRKLNRNLEDIIQDPQIEKYAKILTTGRQNIYRGQAK